MNRGLADRAASRDLVLPEMQTESQTQNFSDFSHGQPLLGHSALLHLSVEKPVPAVVQRRPFKDEVLFRKSFRDVNNDSGTGRISIRFRQESLFTSSRNPYSHHSGIAIHMPRNTHSAPKTNAFGNCQAKRVISASGSNPGARWK
jgi:hypothetical protein